MGGAIIFVEINMRKFYGFCLVDINEVVFLFIQKTKFNRIILQSFEMLLILKKRV